MIADSELNKEWLKAVEESFQVIANEPESSRRLWRDWVSDLQELQSCI
jgi:hypothetical protein